jgi:DMSO/TMAO reductase YedYZ molybdopterin-dependent catalytic subunit
MIKQVAKVVKSKSSGYGRGPREDRGVISARIVAAARTSFAEHGWAGTTMRAVAREAGVDPALVHYYFHSKEDLLEASTTPPPEWIESVRTAALCRGPARLARVLRGQHSWVYLQIRHALGGPR